MAAAAATVSAWVCCALAKPGRGGHVALSLSRRDAVAGTGAAAGHRAGAGAPFTQSRGIWDAQLTAAGGQPQRLGIDPIQFYGEAYFPTIGRGLDVKVGHIFAQYGVESNAGVENALASHAYTFIYDPFTHTGVI